ncbi:MAG: succinate dehydrogenase assembly factor 2 [Limnohabitans sp.]|jgi:antitoxin CptB|nr:succinate dehydrogenase assembly factor 2 [Burkholderiaceae bacterium]NBO00089.1 succinate dehydrogenase assembly factor 2 [Betaproteobacteria bacterium]
MRDERIDALDPAQALDERGLSKLRWRCRRGLLENDLFIERFFDRYAPTLTVGQAQGLYDLMELSDNDLMDLLLGRREPQGSLTQAHTLEVLTLLRA